MPRKVSKVVENPLDSKVPTPSSVTVQGIQKKKKKRAKHLRDATLDENTESSGLKLQRKTSLDHHGFRLIKKSTSNSSCEANRGTLITEDQTGKSRKSKSIPEKTPETVNEDHDNLHGIWDKELAWEIQVPEEQINFHHRTALPKIKEKYQETQKVLVDGLTKVLEKKIKEVSIPRETKDTASNDNDDAGIFLFSNSATRLTAKHLEEQPRRKQKKPILRIKKHVDGSESDDEDSKLRAAAVSAEWVKRKLIF